MGIGGSILLALAAAQGVAVDVGRFNPADFPELIKLDRQLPHPEMTYRVEKMLDTGKCRLAGQTSKKFDIIIPFAILMASDGSPKKVVLGETGCAPLEIFAGQIVLAQTKRGDFRIQHTKGDRWYVSDLYFAQGEPVNASSIADKDKVICQKAIPVLGSRTQVGKICRTAGEWQVYKAQRDQMRRDIGNVTDYRTVE